MFKRKMTNNSIFSTLELRSSGNLGTFPACLYGTGVYTAIIGHVMKVCLGRPFFMRGFFWGAFRRVDVNGHLC